MAASDRGSSTWRHTRRLCAECAAGVDRGRRRRPGKVGVYAAPSRTGVDPTIPYQNDPAIHPAIHRSRVLCRYVTSTYRRENSFDRFGGLVATTTLVHVVRIAEQLLSIPCFRLNRPSVFVCRHRSQFVEEQQHERRVLPAAVGTNVELADEGEDASGQGLTAQHTKHGVCSRGALGAARIV